MTNLAIYQKQDIRFAETVVAPGSNIINQFRVVAIDSEDGFSVKNQDGASSETLVTLGVSQSELYAGGSRLVTVADSGLLAVEINPAFPPTVGQPLEINDDGRASTEPDPVPVDITDTNLGTGYTAGTYTDVDATTSGSGTGLVFSSIVVGGGGAISSYVLDTSGASGYEVDDTLSVLAADVGGTGSGFLLTIDTVESDPVSYAVKCNNETPIVLEHDGKHALVRF